MGDVAVVLALVLVLLVAYDYAQNTMGALARRTHKASAWFGALLKSPYQRVLQRVRYDLPMIIAGRVIHSCVHPQSVATGDSRTPVQARGEAR